MNTHSLKLNKIPIGSFGKMSTFGNRYDSGKPKYVLVVGYCPANSSLKKCELLKEPNKWSNVQDVSMVDRYVIITPKLTQKGRLSPLPYVIAMTPMASSIEKYWTSMNLEEWIIEVAKLKKGETLSIVGTIDYWKK